MSRRVLLLAHPAGHSLSPVMHDAAFAELGMDVRYQALDVPPERLREAVAGLRAPGIVGANVTIPHKQAALELVDAVTPAARSAGAVNTIVPTASGLLGDNTDIEGFLRALAELGIAPAGLDAVVLGAGGASRAAALALLGAGAAVRVFNRTRARARALAESLAAHGAVEVLSADELPAAVADADLLVQATPAGMAGASEGTSPLPEGVLPRAGAVMDLVYRPAETSLLAGARRAGLPVQNGLPMLVHQGALSFERWFERPAPIEVMRRAALAALGRS